jgi:hypothetical protein
MVFMVPHQSMRGTKRHPDFGYLALRFYFIIGSSPTNNLLKPLSAHAFIIIVDLTERQVDP